MLVLVGVNESCQAVCRSNVVRIFRRHHFSCKCFIHAFLGTMKPSCKLAPRCILSNQAKQKHVPD